MNDDNFFIAIKDSLNPVFNKKPKHLWHSYQKKFSKAQDWCIVSDYCLDDKSKPNDCFAFTLFPYHDLNELSKDITSYIPKDIKDVKNISDNTIAFLKEHTYYFNIVFIVENKRRIIQDSRKVLSSREIIKLLLENSCNQYLEHYPLLAQKTKKMLNESIKNGFNSSLFVNILWNALLAAYITAFIYKNTKKCSKTIWIPDRDNMSEYCDGVLFDLYHMNLKSMIQLEKISVPRKNIMAIGKSNNNNFEFDKLIRVPDYFSGVVSSWNLKNNSVEKDKHFQMLKEVILENQRFALIQIKMTDNDLSCGCANIQKIT